MESLINGRIGVAIVSGRRAVSSLKCEGAYEVGWRVGDVISIVNGEKVSSNEELKDAVAKAIVENVEKGTAVNFMVKRMIRAPDTTRGMLRMTPGTGAPLSVSMKVLTKQLTTEFPVVIFLDGTIQIPGNNFAARSIAALKKANIAFKAVDVSNEKYNPGMREVLEELSGEDALPQLYAAGSRLGNGYTIEKLDAAGSLRTRLLGVGALDFDEGGAEPDANLEPPSQPAQTSVEPELQKEMSAQADDGAGVDIEAFYRETISGSGGLPTKGKIVSDLIVRHFHGEWTASGFKRYSGLWKGSPPGTIGMKDIAVGVEKLKEQMKNPRVVAKGGHLDEKKKVEDDGKGWVWIAADMSPGGLGLDLYKSTPLGKRPLFVAKAGEVDAMFDGIDWNLMDKRIARILED